MENELYQINLKLYRFTPEEGWQKAALKASRCPNCQRVDFPFRQGCPDCMSFGNMEEVALSKEGELYSYTVIRVAAKGFKTPYACGWINLPEGIRIFSMLKNCQPFEKKLELGKKMKMTMGEIKTQCDNNTLVGHLFEPVD